jgi:hypothetical protein
MIMRFKQYLLFSFLALSTIFSYAEAIFDIQLASGSVGFPTNISLFAAPAEYSFIITNNSSFDIPNMEYFIPSYFVEDTVKTTCSSTINKNSSCKVALIFRPTQNGLFSDEFKVCGANGNWCSKYSSALQVVVGQDYIVSTNCNDIVSRPFGSLTCNGSKQFSDNFSLFMTRVLSAEATHSEFNYYQHLPSVNETTINCVDARQENVGLDPNILGGGVPLCKLMGYADSSASPTDTSADRELAKLFPPYLTFLLGTPYPITSSTTPLSELATLLQDFNTSAMDQMVQNVGYTGFVNFIDDYFEQQMLKAYSTCGSTNTCPSIAYIPYKMTDGETILQSWPLTNINYWGSSGGGGSGAGYQIYATLPGGSTHYTLQTGGGGGGGGSTTPEISGLITYLLNTGSGGGGGSQFGDCYIRDNVRLTGLGLGAGTGSGLSTAMDTNVTFQNPPAVGYSYLAPAQFPSWSDNTIITNYGSNLTYLFQTQIIDLFNAGYTIVMSCGGGGGSGLEFLDEDYNEFTPHAVSIGHGFNCCYAFNKDGLYSPSDCIPSTTVNGASLTVNEIIYNNIGSLFYQGMKLAILPENCDGYQNSVCTCNFQHAYVIAELGRILVLSGYSVADIPTWLSNPHCNHGQSALLSQAKLMDKDSHKKGKNSYSKILKRFYKSKASLTCSPPWV